MIKRESEKKHVVIVGTSFIGRLNAVEWMKYLVTGMEVAASLVTTAASVTVIGKDPVPFFASLGEQVSLIYMKSTEPALCRNILTKHTLLRLANS